MIQKFFRDLPDHVPPAEVEKAEQSLAEHATNLRPDQLEKVANRLALTLNPDGTFSDDDRARKRGFSWCGGQRVDGMTPHLGMRQYWRDLESLERWTRSEPHKLWWQGFLKDSGGTGFWHETYFMGGGMEAIYDDAEPQIGFARFAPTETARGAMFSARRRAGHGEQPTVQPVITEADYYSN